MKKSNNHIRFHNGQLFCGACGSTQEIPFPIAIPMMTAMAEAWEKMHIGCEGKWEEPKPDMAESEEARIAFWMKHGEHGLSSKCMAWMLQDKPIHPIAETAWPHDRSDFGRCHKLLAIVPEFYGRMDRMKVCGTQWASLVDHWDELTALYEANDPSIGQRIRQLTKPRSST